MKEKNKLNIRDKVKIVKNLGHSSYNKYVGKKDVVKDIIYSNGGTRLIMTSVENHFGNSTHKWLEEELEKNE